MHEGVFGTVGQIMISASDHLPDNSIILSKNLADALMAYKDEQSKESTGNLKGTANVNLKDLFNKFNGA
jgi:hypothetical protein